MKIKKYYLIVSALLLVGVVSVIVYNIFISSPVRERGGVVETVSTPPENRVAKEAQSLGGLDLYGSPASKYSVDSVHAYYAGKLIDADPTTLEVLKGALEKMHGYISYVYARDSRTVFYEGTPLHGVVVEAFRPIENGSSVHNYGTDGKTVYFGAYPIGGADPKTFTILYENMWEGCDETHYSKDETHVYFETSTSTVAVVPNADPVTFVTLINGFGKDRRGYYKGSTFVGTVIDKNELNCAAG